MREPAKLLCSSIVFFALLWVVPRVVLAEEVTPTPTQGPPDGSGTSVTRDPDVYNYFPLVLDPSLPGDEKDKIIANLILDQGYEVYCPHQEWRVNKQIFGDIERYFELHSEYPSIYPVPVILDSNSKYTVDLTTAKIPMLRGNEPLVDTMKNSSLEGLFGALNLEQEKLKDQVNARGVANSLLTPEQQCLAKYNNAAGINLLCSGLESDSECYMNKVIPEMPGYKVLSLFKDMKSSFSGDDFSCKQLSQPWNDEFAQFVDKDKFDKMQAGLNNLSINPDLTYRVGFLVLTMQQNPDESPQDLFWFRGLTKGGALMPNEPKHVPLFLAFKIPDFATNESQVLSRVNYKDTSHLVAELLRTPELNDQLQKEAISEREDLFGSVMANRDSKKNLNCDGIEPCEEGVLQQALVDIINGYPYQCERYRPIEQAGDIGSPAQVTEDKRTYKPEYFTELFRKQPEPSKKEQSFAWEMRWWSLDDAKEPIHGPDGKKGIQVRAHIILPVGVELEQINKTLDTFYTPEGFEAMEKNHVMVDGESPNPEDNRGIPKYYPLKMAGLTFDGGQATLSYEDCEWEKWCGEAKFAKECDEALQCVTRTMGARLIEDSKKEMVVPGADLGWRIRKIQETLRQVGSKGYEYIASCQRTEDLFMGRCGGSYTDPSLPSDPNVTPNPSGVPNSSTMDCPIVLNDTSVNLDKAGFLEEIKRTFPSTKMDSALFDFVVQKSLANGWNPAVALALGREETAWGALGNDHVLGCMAGTIPPDATPQEVADQQTNCLFWNFENTMSCEAFMCRYSGEEGGVPCIFNRNPNFARNFPIFYRKLIGDGNSY